MQRCHIYKIAVSKYQGRCENFFFLFFLGGGGGGGVRSGGEGVGGHRVDVNLGGGEGVAGLGWGGEVRVDVNEELKFWGGGRWRGQDQGSKCPPLPGFTHRVGF